MLPVSSGLISAPTGTAFAINRDIPGDLFQQIRHPNEKSVNAFLLYRCFLL
jgi:hypothetical protein